MDNVPKIGDKLAGKYKITGKIGEGGMGIVLEAEHEALGKRCAIKFVRAEFAENDEVMARFTREARAAAAIGHKSIIDVYDVGMEDGAAYLVMEYLVGESLGEALEEREKLEFDLALYVVSRVLSALDAAHSKGIVHRDLKPDNVFLVETDEARPDVKLLDFGISKVMEGDDGPKENLTATGALIGTPLFMAPEQAMGDRDVDHLVDVYATGVILYKCLTGELPFSGENAVALLVNVVSEPITPPSQHNPQISPELEQIVLRSMATNKKDRYQTAGEMLNELRPFLDDIGIAASSPSSKVIAAAVSNQAKTMMEVPPNPIAPSQADTGGSSKKRAIPATIGVTGGATLSPVASTGVTDQSTPMSWEEGKAPPKKGGKGLYIAIAAVVLLLGVGGAIALMLGGDDDGGGDGTGTTAAAQGGPTEPATPAGGDTTPTKTADPAPATPATTENIVTLTLEGVPEGANVFYNGAGVEGTELRVEHSALMREVRVETADGRRWSRMIAPEQDRTIEVTFESTKVAKNPGQPRGPRPTKGGATPAKTPAKTPTKSGGTGSFFGTFE